MRRMLLVGVVAVGMTLGVSAQALAVTTVSRSGNVITITGGDEVNYVDQPGTYGQIKYSDPAGINYGTGCSDAGNNTVDCGASGPGLVAQVNLGGGDDTFRPDSVYNDFPKLTVDLGAGNDTMWGSALDDTLNGGPGDDTINGRGGNDKIDGGEGRDRLSGADGDDTITGGPGVDSLFGDGEYTSLSGYGNDTLLARDGEADALSCSFGADSAVADASDTFDVLGDCEQRDIAAAAGPVAPGPVAPGPSSGALTVGLGAPKPVRLGALLSGAGPELQDHVLRGLHCDGGPRGPRRRGQATEDRQEGDSDRQGRRSGPAGRHLQRSAQAQAHLSRKAAQGEVRHGVPRARLHRQLRRSARDATQARVQTLRRPPAPAPP